MEGEKKKGILKVVSIEALIISILIVVIIAILSFLKIISFSNIFPFFTAAKSTQQSKGYYDSSRAILLQSPTPAVIDQTSASQATITATSQNPNYSLSIENEKELIQILNGWLFYGRSYVYKGSSANGQPLKNLKVELVETPGTDNILSDKNGSYTTTDLLFDNDTLTMKIYFAPRIFEHYTLSRMGDVLLSTTLFNAYKLTNNTTSQDSTNQAMRTIEETTSSLKQMHANYFVVSKR